MAFQQPTLQTMQRIARSSVEDQAISSAPNRTSQEQQPEESQTWVLFAPPTEATATSYLSETERSVETPGRSRLSDLGSLNTVARTESASVLDHTDGNQSAVLSVAIEEPVAEDAELDSLDGHLPGFRSLPRSNQHVFPSHDGLGSFRLDQPALGQDAQDHIYQFEKFNPRRVRRRFNSFDQGQFELEQAQVQESEKRQRIEAWRLEHSRIILEEVQRETKKRQRSLASSQRVQPAPVPASESDNMTWHEQESSLQEEGLDDQDDGFLKKITCKVLRDLLGLDERLLSVLLGDEIPNDEELSLTPRVSQMNREQLQPETEDSWQVHILERVSKELGLLVNQLSKHPGAFSTYTRMQQMPLPYAGLPVIPESADGRAVTQTTASEQVGEPGFPEFKPTVHPASASVAKPINIPSQKSHDSTAMAQEDLAMLNTFTQEEWEKDLDIKLVFRYLVSRFSRSDASASSEPTRHNSMKSQDAAAKAARVRQHHPLISRPRPTERRSFKATAPSSPVALRHQSSCASQSTRRSARRSSCSSRHYWDIGGSVGTGSMIAANGPMGSWGEV